MQRSCIPAFVLFPLVATIGCAAAQATPEAHFTPPSHLSKLHVEVSDVRGVINCSPALSVVLMQKIDEGDTLSGEPALRAVQTKISSQDSDTYVIDFEPGPSIDPTFIVHRKEDQALVRVGALRGTELTIPGDGSIFVSGVIDDYFDRVRKFVLKERMIVEAVQPFYYVGITSTIARSLSLYSDTSSQDIVEHLPSGSVIEVLLARANYREEVDEDGSKHQTFSGYDFLAKSRNGLLGWVRAGGQCGEEDIKGLCFHGD